MVNSMVAMAWAIAAAGVFALVVSYLKWKKKNDALKKLVPQAVFNEFGNLKDLESFGDYVGMIIGPTSVYVILNWCLYWSHLPARVTMFFL